MNSDITQAQYDQLDAIAARFGSQAEAHTAFAQRLKHTFDLLMQDGWQGKGATAFSTEMQNEVFPAYQRMREALQQAQSVTLQIKNILQAAEREAALLFQGAGQPGRSDQPTVPSDPNNYDRFDRALTYMHQELVNNARGSTTRMIKDLIDSFKNPQWYDLIGGNPGGKLTAALSMWAGKVHSGGDWDHKPKLAEALGLKSPPDYYFPLRGDPDHEYYYDIWSNIHYGYVGTAAGFDPSTLQDGAALGDSFTGVNDPGDELTVQIGIDLWNKYGDKLTPEQLHQEILAHKDELVKFDKAKDPRNRR